MLAFNLMYIMKVYVVPPYIAFKVVTQESSENFSNSSKVSHKIRKLA